MNIRQDSFSYKAVIGIAALLAMLGHSDSLSAQTASQPLPDAPTPNLIAYSGQAQEPSPNQTPAQPASPDAQQPSSSSQAPPSLGDLGLTPEQLQGNAKAQALLDKRTHMLKDHQRWGLWTTIPLTATLISSGGAPCKKNCGNSVGEDLHVALGAVSGDMYAITAYYAIAAPKIPGTEKKGAIRLHEALAWVHGPGMILTPVLGAIAFKQQHAGEKVHGIASAHAPVAITTVAAYDASILAVSWPIRIKFWEHL
ncbi:MAG: hypothetical protein ABSF70_14495 [Terracidiphilus sp.]|jgi:hypothetical protein